MNKEDIISDIKKWCDMYNVKGYTINDDLSVDVECDVDISCRGVTDIPFQFGNINGSFDCSVNLIKSLKGCPTFTLGDFDCSANYITSLEYCPNDVAGDFFVDDNFKLTSIDFIPAHIGEQIICHKCNFNPDSYTLLFASEFDLKDVITDDGVDLVALKRKYYIDNLKND